MLNCLKRARNISINHASAIALMGCITIPLTVHSAPLELEFRPPEIAPLNVCIPRESDQVTIDYWEAWDGKSFGDLTPALIKRDIKRLQHIDSIYWSDTIQLMIDKLEERDPSYAGKNSLLTRIQAMAAAGEFQKIRSLQLVQQLSVDSDTASPRIQNALAEFYRNGVGVDQNIERADELLINAGYAGNADAMLELVKRDINGTPVPGWTVPNELSVTMAFGSLVGELNSTICDRTARIAREYHNGEVVAKNPDLAREWFRFTADLGDANAAWKLVEYHIQSEGFEKDNTTLLKYLEQASDAGLPFAQIELGRLYESGSLVERDLDKTLSLFRAAAEAGERPGLTRLGLFLEDYASLYPDLYAEKIATFEKLSGLPDAPGWVFTRLAQNIHQTSGRWSKTKESIQYLEKAAALGDMDGTGRLAQALLANGTNEQDFERAVTLLSRVVSVHGGVTPSKQLRSAFMCQAEDSPRLIEAKYWEEIELATDTANVDLNASELVTLTSTRTPRTLAVLQSQALYGRPSSLASWLKFLELDLKTDEDLKSFWTEYSNEFDFVLEALAKLELQLAANREDRLAAFDLLRLEFRKSGATAAVSLARALLNENAGRLNEEVEDILRLSAKEGIGDAIQLLASLNSSNQSPADIYTEYEAIIEENGDFDAMVFALPFVNPGQQDIYFQRAVGLIQCDYKNAMTLARVAFGLGKNIKGEQWIDIASHLSEGNAWAYADLADAKLRFLGMDRAEEAAELFRIAAVDGSMAAKHKLFDLLINTEASTFQPKEAVQMIITSIDSTDFDSLSAYLGRIRRAEESVKTYVAANLDLPEVHRIAAESGDIFAMRYYGMHLRENAVTASDLSGSTEWIKLAAEGGDVTAMAEYGQALAFGIGVDSDLERAKSWLSEAAENGNKKAKQIMALVSLTGQVES